MQDVVAKCPKVCISTHGIQIPSLLDSGSEMILLWQSYFNNRYILPKIKPVSGQKADAHTLVKLTVANDGLMPIKKYTELDLTFWGLKVLNVDVVIAEDPNQVLDEKHQTKLPGIVGWNLIWLSYNVFIQKYGTTGFDSFMCLEGVNPLFYPSCAFFTILMYERTKHWEQHLKLCPNILKLVSPQRQMTCLKNDWWNFRGKDGAIGQVMIGSKQNPVCVPSNSSITVLGQTSKIPSRVTCLVEQAHHHNLPLGIVINRCVATTKARSVPIILINTINQNV